MKRRALAPALLVLASCSQPTSFHGEEFAQYYRHPTDQTSMERIDRKEIIHWKAGHPKSRRKVGYLSKYETQLKGSREIRECYYIHNESGTEAIGFITAEGVFYRFNKSGRFDESTRMEHPIETGLKIFFGFDLKDQILLSDLDPYK